MRRRRTFARGTLYAIAPAWQMEWREPDGMVLHDFGYGRELPDRTQLRDVTALLRDLANDNRGDLR